MYRLTQPVAVFFAVLLMAACGSGGDSPASGQEVVPQGNNGASMLSDSLPSLPVGALECSDNFPEASREPVLLIHGTALNPANNFAWNWQPALEMDNRPYCTLALVNDGMGDAQESAERVVLALKEMNAMSDQKVPFQIISQ